MPFETISKMPRPVSEFDEHDLQSFLVLTMLAKMLVPTKNISGKALKLSIPSRTITTTLHRIASGLLFFLPTTVASHHPAIQTKKSCFPCIISYIASTSSESPTSACTQPHRLCHLLIMQTLICAWSSFASK